jgi:hypothetical protein
VDREEDFSSMCVVCDGIVQDLPPPMKPSKCSTNSSQSQQPLAKGVKSLRDEEAGDSEQYNLHFGTTVIDTHGKGRHDYTVNALINGASCIIISLGKCRDLGSHFI